MNNLTIKTDDLRHEALKEIIALKTNQLYIWGNGSYSRDIEEYLKTEGGFSGQIVNIIDDEYFISDEAGTMSFSQFLSLGDRQSPLVFGFYNYSVIQKKKEKWASFFPHMYDFHFTIVNGKRLTWNPFLAKQREEKYRESFHLLSDARSRRVMQLYLNAATAGEFHKLFVEGYEEPAYFNRITEWLNIDVLIDCGAYDGDSIHDFISIFPAYKKIVAIEPDSSNLQRLLQRAERESIHGLTVVNKGVGSKNGVFHFHANGESNAFLVESGESEVSIIKLDDLCSEITGTILLKMDIEGAELDALHGAQEFIRSKHPILTICVYHREEDLIEIPQFIHETVGADVYNYYIGFHGLDLAECVLYAIPVALNYKKPS